ncbi:envelope glycoprotein N [Mandrillus leucophaeus cytomegalovirus]|uniref:Envelope glycoprotein N n=1 Tax=Mandrillus leucophaeus cytomegalovirus TaxID=1654930 RepID=A0A0G2UGP0_9BETA|nr:envelope glycoprotein N [Mandrillus leucophaeus cytomegalovirus]AKI29773.1 envelope glycoprotein N [Mandrillus leucophaeus cytomegalovirus]
MKRKIAMRLVLWTCLVALCVANSSSSSTTSTTSATTTTLKPIKPHNNADFFSAQCTSHMYQVSMKSFAAVWICLNVVLLVISFCVVLRHCCFQNFTTTTVAGY